MLTTALKVPKHKLTRPAVAEFCHDPLLTILECRQILNCSYSHVDRLIRSGLLVGWQACKHGSRRIRTSELRRYLESGTHA